MPTFERGDVVRVPFPYTDSDTRQHRPALVVSDGGVGGDERLLWVAMITGAGNRQWDGDIPIAHDAMTGLPIPSVVRPTKVAAVDAHHAEKRGMASSATVAMVIDRMVAILGRAAPE